MTRRPPGSTRSDSLMPYTALYRCGIARDRGDLEVDVRERGRAAAFGSVEVHHQRRDPLAAALEWSGRSGPVGIEVVMMRFVLRAHAVAQDLARHAVPDRLVQQPGDPRLAARHQWGAVARDVRTRPGAVRSQECRVG